MDHILPKNRLFLTIIVLGIGIALRLIWGYFSLINLPPSTDEGMLALMAEGIRTGKDYPILSIGQPYQFPIEAYLMAPFVDYLPHNALGVRYQAFLLALVSTFLFLMIARVAFEKENRWPAYLLIILPSSYWLSVQVGYVPIQYSISTVLCALIFLSTLSILEQSRHTLALTFIAGLLSGLALSNHLLALSVVAAAMIVILFSSSARETFKRLALLSIGLLLGLTPYLYAIMYIPGAYESFSDSLPIAKMFNRLWHVIYTQTFPGTMGINPPYLGDYPPHLAWPDIWRKLFLICASGLFLVIILIRLTGFLKSSIRHRWPSLAWPDLFLLTTLFSLGLMAVRANGGWADHRYVISAVWCFPFLVAYLYSYQPKPIKIFIGFFVLSLAVFNVTSSVATITEWQKPANIQEHGDIPDITKLKAWMSENDFQHCYASFWLAYRATFEADGKAICAPIYNERFNGWPIPFKDEVDQSNKVVFVMSNTYGSKFSAGKFKQIMHAYDINYKSVQFGPLSAYYDFYSPDAAQESILEPSEYVFSGNPSKQKFALLSDRNLLKDWQSEARQTEQQYLDIHFKQTQNIQSVNLYYPLKNFHAPRSLRIKGFKNGEWITLVEEERFRIDKMRFENKHPIFGANVQTIRFKPQAINALRVEIHTPQIKGQWDLSEVSIGVKDD